MVSGFKNVDILGMLHRQHKRAPYRNRGPLLQSVIPSVKHWHALEHIINLKEYLAHAQQTSPVQPLSMICHPCGHCSLWTLTIHIKEVLNPKTNGTIKLNLMTTKIPLTLQSTLWNINIKPRFECDGEYEIADSLFYLIFCVSSCSCFVHFYINYSVHYILSIYAALYIHYSCSGIPLEMLVF